MALKKEAKKKLFEKAELATVHGGALGILMPMMQNQWELKRASCLSEDELNLLNVSVIKLRYNFCGASDLFVAENSLHLVIEEPRNAGIGPVIRKLMLLKDYEITIASLDGDSTPLQLKTFLRCRGLNYTYDLDYSSSDTCKYKLNLTFDDLAFN